MTFSPFRLALDRYARIRQGAYEFVVEETIRLGHTGPELSLTGIDDRAAAAWSANWRDTHPSGDGGWDWDQLARKFLRRPSAFHLAVWYEGRLCGLAVGRMSRRRRSAVRHTVSIHYMEREPGSGHPLSGTISVLVFTAAEQYGKRLGASRLRLMDPLPGLLRYYSQLGFTIASLPGNRIYCERRIRQ